MQATVGDFYIHNKMYTKAEAIYENMLSIDGQNSSYYNNLAWIKQSLNKLDEALVAAQSAMSLSEDNPYFMDTIGYIEYKRGNLDAAYKHLSRAAKMLPNVPDVQLHYSELLITLDFNQKAANILRQLKTQSPQQAAKKEQLLNSTK